LESPTTQKSQKTRDLKTSQQVQNLKDFQIRSFDKLQNSRHRYELENSQHFQPAKDLKNLKKSSFKPLFSIILASVMGAGVAYAFSDTCTLGSANACLAHTGANAEDKFKPTQDETHTDKWRYTDGTKTHEEKSGRLTITGNKIILEEPNLYVHNTANLTANFKDSVWVGNFTHAQSGGGHESPINLSFEGHYNGDTDVTPTIKGKDNQWAFIGNINLQQKNTITFKNGANMKGNITGVYYAAFIDSDIATVTFDNSSLIGNINVSDGDNTFKFINNAHMKGNITYLKNFDDKGNLAITTKDSSIEGNLSVSSYSNHLGGSKSNVNEQKITLEFDGNGKEGYAFKGNIYLRADDTNKKPRPLTLTIKNEAKILGSINVAKSSYGPYWTGPFNNFNLNITNASFDANQVIHNNSENMAITLDGGDLLNAGNLISKNQQKNAPYTFTIKNTSENKRNGYSSGDIYNIGNTTITLEKDTTFASTITNAAISGSPGKITLTANENTTIIGGLGAGASFGNNDITQPNYQKSVNHFTATFTNATLMGYNAGKFGAGSGAGIINQANGGYIHATFTSSAVNGDITAKYVYMTPAETGYRVNDVIFASAAVNPTASGGTTLPKIDYAPANKAANKSAEVAMVPTTTHKLDYFLPHLPSTGTNETLNQTAITKFYGALMTEAKLKGMSGDQIQGYVIAGIQDYLRLANISSFVGNITTSGDKSVNNVEFNNALYLRGNITTTGGVANISLNLSDEFYKSLTENELTKALLLTQSPKFNVTTTGGVANIAMSGNIKGTANFNYSGGETNLIFADKAEADKTADAVGTHNHLGDTTKFNDSTKYVPTDTAKNTVKVNGTTYTDGIIVRLDASKADKLLSFYRNRFDSLPANLQKLFTSASAKGASMSMELDKSDTTNNVYKGTISGILIGDVYSLPTSNGSSGTAPKYEATLTSNAVFVGDLHIKNTIDIALNSGAKLILNGDSHIANLKGAGKPENFDEEHLAGNSLYQTNTIIDLATGGISVRDDFKRNHFSALSIDKAENFENAVFRVAYNPYMAGDLSKPASNADHIIIKDASNSKENILQVFQSQSNGGEVGDLSSKNILVASVAKKAETAGFKFSTHSVVNQGFDVVTTDLVAKNGNDEKLKADGTKSTTTSENTTEFTNYYVSYIAASLNQAYTDTSKATLGSNLSVFLANINDLNKRLGELRSNPYTQGVWARVFNGSNHSNIGDSLETLSTNVQGGYDYAFNHNNARSIVGLAFSYGYNNLTSNAFSGNSNLFEVGAYYSFIQENAQGSGIYSDTILKYGYISNNLNIKDNKISIDNKLSSQAFSLGEEVGYRFNFNLSPANAPIHHALYVEPSAELILGYLTGGSLKQMTSGNFLLSSIGNVFDVRAKLGGTLGYSLLTQKNRTDFRLGAFYVGDYFAGGKMDFTSTYAKAEDELKSNHMGMVSVGINSFITKDIRLYLDVDAGFGGKYYNQDYLVSLGGRYSFGERTSTKVQELQRQQNNPTNQPSPSSFEKNLTPEQRKLLKNKQVLILKTNNKTHCQGC
ncbi:autotransporter outer membrane beta-barrel domain-containing protein, partial [Helicobacter sp. 11S02596-1]|uniref:autotransporter outer membrane beta-barrel domain-containing protein n=1 Tax=Helicobacter sp. 11S02596-1 TaxID=1476194 RepID=UPI00117AE5FE